MNGDRQLEERLRQLSWPVDRGSGWAGVEARADEHRRAAMPTRSGGGWKRGLAIVFALIALMGGAAYGVHELVAYLHPQPVLVITDMTVQSGGGATSATGTAGTFALSGLVPVAGTAVLQQVKSDGATIAAGDSSFVERVTGQVQVFSLQTSQPEIGGALELTTDLYIRTDGSADVRGRWVLTNDRGTWLCDAWSGYRSADGAEEFGSGSAAGAGRYEGLTLYLQWHFQRVAGSTIPGMGSAESVSITGWVQSVE